MISLTFLFVLLPAGLLVYHIAPRRTKTTVLLLISLFCCFYVQPYGLLLMLVSILMDYAALRVMKTFDSSSRIRRSCFWFSIFKSLIMIVYVSALMEAQRMGTVFGLLVYTLSAMDCVISIYRRETEPIGNIVSFALYCSFFPKLQAGPLDTWQSFSKQTAEPLPLTLSSIVRGLNRLFAGGIKYLLFGEFLQSLYETLQLQLSTDASILSGWAAVLSLALSVYYRFSGLCDMARGAAELFGFALPQNYYFPLQSQSIGDFFNRFNSTVYRFLNQSIVSGLQMEGDSRAWDALSIIIVGMLCGLWFGITVNMIMWGAFLSLFIIMERYLYAGILRRIPTLFCRVYACLIVIISFSFFAGDSVRESARYLKIMFSFGVIPFTNSQTGSILLTNGLLLALSCFFALSFYSKAADRWHSSAPRSCLFGTAVLDAVLLVILSSLLIQGPA